MLARLKKYKTTLRTTGTPVTHPTYQTTKTLNPVEFAVYETCLKCEYIRQFIGAAMSDQRQLLGLMVYYQQLADPCRISLPHIPGTWLNEAKRAEASADFRATASWIAEAGLYYDLLD
jgi:hypothetical protein